MPNNEPEVDSAYARRFQEVFERLKAAGLSTDVASILGTDADDMIKGMSTADRMITSVSTSMLMLIRNAPRMTDDEVVSEIADLIEMTIAQGGVMVLEHIAETSEEAVESVVKEHGPPPTKLDEANINFYILAKNMEMAHEALQKRRNSLRFRKFKEYADKAIAQKEKKS